MKKLILLLIIPFIFTSCVNKSNNKNYDGYDWKRISPPTHSGIYVFKYEGHEYMVGPNSTPRHTENCKYYDDSIRKINTK
jgi:hypothetical protein